MSRKTIANPKVEALLLLLAEEIAKVAIDEKESEMLLKNINNIRLYLKGVVSE